MMGKILWSSACSSSTIGKADVAAGETSSAAVLLAPIGKPLRGNDLGLEDGRSLGPGECSGARPRVDEVLK